MKQIIADFQFWFSAALIVIGFVMFKLINRSFKKQKKKLENPQKNLENDLRKMAEYFRGLLPGAKIRVNSNTGIAYIVTVFMMAIGIIALIATFAKY